MEIPYRSSNAGSEGQRSSIVGQPVTAPTLGVTTNSSTSVTPTKGTSTISNLFNRHRQRSQRPYVYEEMKWTMRRKSSKGGEQKPEEIPLNEDANDCRISVV